MNRINFKKALLLVLLFFIFTIAIIFASYKYNEYQVDQVIINFSNSTRDTENQYLSQDINKLKIPYPKPTSINSIQGSAFDSIPIIAMEGYIANRYAGSNNVFMLIKEKGEWKIYGWRRLK